MKTPTKIIIVCTLTAFGSLLHGADEAPKFRWKVDVGPAFLQDMEVKRGSSFLPITLPTGVQPGNIIGTPTISWDPGFRFSLAPGYSIDDCLSVELEFGLVYSSADKIRLQFSGPPPIQVEEKADISLYQVPILANLVYRFPLKGKIKPYLGVGIGGVGSLVEIDSTSDDDFTYGFQGMAGVAYQINPNMDVGIGYKFLGTTDHDFDFNGEVKTGSTLTHAIVGVFSYRF